FFLAISAHYFINLHSSMLLLYRFYCAMLKFVKINYIPLCFYFISPMHPDIVHYIHLHSTMLLLYRMLRIQTIQPDQNLHSTMLLLYLNLLKQYYARRLNLHSTMLLLYLFRLNVERFINSFTFHYASTLSLSCVLHPRSNAAIYIPLCFYFIRSHHQSYRSLAYLHSTMLLLYLIAMRYQRCRS